MGSAGLFSNQGRINQERNQTKMKKVTIRQSSENVVYVTLNGKVIYIDDSIKGELTIDAWDEETEEPINPTLAQ